MDNVIELNEVVQRVVAEYASGGWYKARAYFINDESKQIYAVASIPDPDYPIREVTPGMAVMARVVGDQVVIEHDSTDKPLIDALMAAGIRREQIIVPLAGDALPDAG